jgi:XTP/dITP diphosphohydrolase
LGCDAVRLVLASNNAKKLAELQALFAPLKLELVTQGALGIPEAEEPHVTFVENALAKARHAARLTNGPALADDSGLCVDALGGAPGAISAHFAGLVPTDVNRETQRSAQDDANNRLLIERMDSINDRRARFVSTLIAVRSAHDPEPLIATGRWEGEILRVPAGQGGFGYDPLMFIPALCKAAAELEPAVKNAHSHRALAARRMLVLMREVWRLD